MINPFEVRVPRLKPQAKSIRKIVDQLIFEFGDFVDFLPDLWVLQLVVVIQ